MGEEKLAKGAPPFTPKSPNLVTAKATAVAAEEVAKEKTRTPPFGRKSKSDADEL